MLACLPTGYGKSLINLPPVRVAAELSVVYNNKDLFSTEPVVDESGKNSTDRIFKSPIDILKSTCKLWMH